MLSLPSLFLALIATLGYVSRWFGPGTVDRTERQIENTLSRAFSQQVVQQRDRPDPARGAARRPRRRHQHRLRARAVGRLVGDRDVRQHDHHRLRHARPARPGAQPAARALAVPRHGGARRVRCCRCSCWARTCCDARSRTSVRHTVSTLINAGYYPVLVVLLLLGLTTFYKLAPPRRLPWHRGLPGAVLAVLVFLAGSAGLRAYIRFILDHNHAYGDAGRADRRAAVLLRPRPGRAARRRVQRRHRADRSRRKVKPPRVLDPRNWQMFSPDGGRATPPTRRRRTGDGAATGATPRPVARGLPCAATVSPTAPSRRSPCTPGTPASRLGRLGHREHLAAQRLDQRAHDGALGDLGLADVVEHLGAGVGVRRRRRLEYLGLAHRRLCLSRRAAVAASGARLSRRRCGRRRPAVSARSAPGPGRRGRRGRPLLGRAVVGDDAPRTTAAPCRRRRRPAPARSRRGRCRPRRCTQTRAQRHHDRVLLAPPVVLVVAADRAQS